MVIVSNEWIENVEDTKSFLGTTGLIMASTENIAINSTDNTVKNDWKQQQQSSTNTTNNRSNNSQDCARALLVCQPNSHPFQTRTLILEPTIEIKVGRSIARSRVAENNAIFDCKVLSRNHAVLWYDGSKFYVKDTKSSNGTFINDRRIDQSDPEPLNSGDVVKFGVDVIENCRKEVHGCIIACVKLYMPDGREAISNNTSRLIPGEGTISLDELHRLHHYMQEAVQREKMLETKLHDIKKVIDVTRRNTSSCWQAMIDEDRLLNRIDILENKLQFFQKNAPEDRLREEILKLQDDKSLYQNSAKEALRKVYQERMEAMQKLTSIERALCSSEDECSLLRDQLHRTQTNLQEVNSRLTRFEAECKEHRENNEKNQSQVQKQDSESQQLQEQYKQQEVECLEMKSQISALKIENNSLLQRLYQKYCNTNEDDDDTISKNSKTSSRSTVMKWLENSDLKNKEGSADIFKAICNDVEANEDAESRETHFSKLYEKLLTVEKDLEETETETPEEEPLEEDDENSTSSSSISDGNQNLKTTKNDNCRDVLKTASTSLKDVHNEIIQYLNSIKKLEEDNHRAQEGYDELETKLNAVQDELKALQLELRDRPTYNEFQEKITMNEYMQIEIDNLKLKAIEMEEQIVTLDHEKEELEKALNDSEIIVKKETKSISLQTESVQSDECDANNEILSKTILLEPLAAVANTADATNLTPTTRPSNDKNIHDNDDYSIDDDKIKNELDVINNAAIQHEEELILFKEKYASIVNENLELKHFVECLKGDLRQLQRQFLSKLIIYGAIFIAFISYFLFSFS